MKSCENCFWAYNCYNPSEDWDGYAEECGDYYDASDKGKAKCHDGGRSEEKD